MTEGESLAKVAADEGFVVGTVWDHPDNASIREKRGKAYLVEAADVVVIPPRPLKNEVCATGRRHCFRLISVPLPNFITFQARDGLGAAGAATCILEHPDGTLEDVTLDEDGSLHTVSCPFVSVAHGPMGGDSSEPITIVCGDDVSWKRVRAGRRTHGVRPSTTIAGTVEGTESSRCSPSRLGRRALGASRAPCPLTCPDLLYRGVERGHRDGAALRPNNNYNRNSAAGGAVPSARAAESLQPTMPSG
jgi:hypothetical protein